MAFLPPYMCVFSQIVTFYMDKICLSEISYCACLVTFKFSYFSSGRTLLIFLIIHMSVNELEFNKCVSTIQARTLNCIALINLFTNIKINNKLLRICWNSDLCMWYTFGNWWGKLTIVIIKFWNLNPWGVCNSHSQLHIHSSIAYRAFLDGTDTDQESLAKVRPYGLVLLHWEISSIIVKNGW